MVHNHYVLKRSRVAIVFQAILGLIISILLYVQLSVWLWLICTVILIVIVIKFNQRPQLEYLYQLDDVEWSIQLSGETRTHRVLMSHLIDHHLYISIYFSDKNIKNCIIWMDQLETDAWKSLKIRAKLN